MSLSASHNELNPLLTRITGLEQERWPEFDDDWGINSYFKDYFEIGIRHSPNTILEIGVRYGYCMSAAALGAFTVRKQPMEYWGMDVESIAGSNEVAKETFRMLTPFMEVHLHRLDSSQIPSIDFCKDVDLIHVDGGHTSEGVIMEMALALPHLAQNGVMVVDDFKYEVVRNSALAFTKNNCLTLLAEYKNERNQGVFVRG
jgi:cephalosporin hydroxylase